MPILTEHGMIIFTIIIMFQMLKALPAEHTAVKNVNEGLSENSRMEHATINFTETELSEFI